MPADRKKKLRKGRLSIHTLNQMGFVVGKLYEFKGRTRLLYKTQSPKASQKTSLPKVRTNDHVMFLGASLFECARVKMKTVWEPNLAYTKARLINANNTIVKTEKASWSSNMTTILYRSNAPLYSGMMHVGFGDRFGWINIVQMSEKNIYEQFKQVNLDE